MTSRKVAALLIALALIPSPAHARGPWRASEANTRGWQLMTPEERIDHQARMRSFTSYEECLPYQAEVHRRMEERARERGLTLSPGPGGCEHLNPARRSR